MTIRDKIIIDGIKILEDCYINNGIYKLLFKKLSIMNTIPELMSLISPPDSKFNIIKKMVGPFLNKFTVSANIIESNKSQFFNKALTSNIPKDLQYSYNKEVKQ